jgi:hypothetical protein
MSYRCEAASVEGFVQQLACNLVNKGYWYYVIGEVPARKDPAAVDRKLIEMYKLDQSKWARARRKAKGLANVAYLRYERFFVLLATAGEHILYQREAAVRDFRRQPLRFQGYSIGCGKGSDGRYHASVKIDIRAFSELQAYFLNGCLHRSEQAIATEFLKIRFTPFARVRRQLVRLLGEVNSARKAAGFSVIPITSLNLRRNIYRPFKTELIDDAAINNLVHIFLE